MDSIDQELVAELNRSRNAANCHTINKAICYYDRAWKNLEKHKLLETAIRDALKLMIGKNLMNI